MISRSGSVDFMCYQRYDSASISASRIDSENGGSFSVAPMGDMNIRQSYLPDTSVFVTRFESDSAVCEMLDSMPIKAARFATSDLTEFEPPPSCARNQGMAMFFTSFKKPTALKVTVIDGMIAG
jgi:GH15 family glucan-1,4-alpha-glucosidase